MPCGLTCFYREKELERKKREVGEARREIEVSYSILYWRDLSRPGNDHTWYGHNQPPCSTADVVDYVWGDLAATVLVDQVPIDRKAWCSTREYLTDTVVESFGTKKIGSLVA